MKLVDRIAADRRLQILRLLAEGDHSSEVLLAVVLQAPQDLVRTDLGWLAENGLVVIEEIGGLRFASLAQRGLETAAGVVATPGVAKPSRRERSGRISR